MCALEEHGNALVIHSLEEEHSPCPTTPLSLQQQIKTTQLEEHCSGQGLHQSVVSFLESWHYFTWFYKWI
jgi:hypothetical protein